MTSTFSFDTPTREQWRGRFRADLGAALTRQRMTHKQLAKRIHVRQQTVSEWLHGRAYPLPQLAAELADALDTPHLATLVIAGRTITCELCGKTTVAANKGGSAKLYCGVRCKSAATDRRRRGVTILDSHLTRHRLVEHQQAVDAMCRECTLGEGLCPQWECPLRCVSPLPLTIAAERERVTAEAARAAAERQRQPSRPSGPAQVFAVAVAAGVAR